MADPVKRVFLAARWPSVSCWTRRRTSSTIAEPGFSTWKSSRTGMASGSTSRNGSSSAVLIPTMNIRLAVLEPAVQASRHASAQMASAISNAWSTMPCPPSSAPLPLAGFFSNRFGVPRTCRGRRRAERLAPRSPRPNHRIQFPQDGRAGHRPPRGPQDPGAEPENRCGQETLFDAHRYHAVSPPSPAKSGALTPKAKRTTNRRLLNMYKQI
jgi:hypothetical protein